MIKHLLAPALLLCCAPAHADWTAYTDRLIVKQQEGQPALVGNGARRQTLAMRAGSELQPLRRTAAGAEVLRLPHALPLHEVEAMAARLRASSDIEYAEPDYRRRAALVPNDAHYSEQWYAFEDAAGIRLPEAWDIRTGGAVNVAIVDTGLRPHAEFAARILPGYDFIAEDSPGSFFTANDGNGRDADASDPGDWIGPDEASPDCPESDSSWHGTLLAGLIGAAGDNAAGIAGINWQARLLPVRALGRCGGYVSDIADGLRWAVGLAVAGVPANANPARIINLSLGSTGPCSTTEQEALDAATAAGALVIVPAGNDGDDVSDSAPANCRNAFVVAALARSGALAYYSNHGGLVTLAAPGGDELNGLVSTFNSGLTTPGADDYASFLGNSFSVPLVAGTAALMLAVKPSLTREQLRAQLIQTTRDFPDASCNTSLCGAGVLDAGAALAAVAGAVAPIAHAGADQNVKTGATVTLQGSASDDAAIAAYQWTQTGGASVTLNGANSATASFTAPANAGTLSLQLTVTDADGLSDSDSVTVNVNTGSGGGGGGGGSADWMLPGLLAMAARRSIRNRR
jgi:serine protease